VTKSTGTTACAGWRDCAASCRTRWSAGCSNSRGTPNFCIQFHVLNARGEHAGVTTYPGGTYAVCDEGGPRSMEMEPLLQGSPRD
jgi:hypothetical protein